MIDISTLKQIPITDYLTAIGHPYKITNGTAYACASVVRSGADNPRNFTVTLRKNLWHDQVSGKGGSIIDLVMLNRQCDYTTAIRWLQDFSGQREEKENLSLSSRRQISENTEGEVVVLTTHALQHPMWLNFVRSRCVSLALAMKYLSEVQFAFRSDLNAKFWGVGWQGRNGRWHIRTQMTHLKHVSQSPNEVTHFLGNRSSVCIFEGILDYLAFLTMGNRDRLAQDAIVLNSVKLVEQILPSLNSYSSVHLYLDNDQGGSTCTNRILEVYPTAIDHRPNYAQHKDVNEYWQAYCAGQK